MNLFENFTLLAQPWWVNLLIFIPIIAYLIWRSTGLKITKRQLLFAFFFAIAFGFVEATVVIYLRAAIGFLPGYEEGTLNDIIRLSSGIYDQTKVLSEFPKSLLTLELFREVATMIMLVSISLLTVKGCRERWAIFLWTFAIWEIMYYISLYLTVGWPASLLDPDVLFLIPVPWLAQVWFPILVSILALVAVLLAKNPDEKLSKN